MKNLIIISSGFVAIMLALYAGVSWYTGNYPSVNSFEECEKAGYSIQESRPRVCTAGVKSFSETSKR